MTLISLECDDVETYLTEYSRDQLSSSEKKEIDAHLETCRRCRRAYDEILELSGKIDKIIPVVTRTYEKDFIYRLFINSKPESIYVKIFSVIFIICLVGFMASSFFYTKDYYTSIKSLEYRAKSMFNENYFSHGQNK